MGAALTKLWRDVMVGVAWRPVSTGGTEDESERVRHNPTESDRVRSPTVGRCL